MDQKIKETKMERKFKFKINIEMSSKSRKKNKGRKPSVNWWMVKKLVTIAFVIIKIMIT
tara:strand:- start:151 stop:327 length:177 start_codon:yes stop_codon:yes gene_type:complete